MPGFDGTGPRGTGPMTGGGRGFCVMTESETTDSPPNKERGVDYADELSSTYEQRAEIDALKNEVKELKDTLAKIGSQIEKLVEK
ncbi:MAG: DUF5320 domain-containing protein [Dehalococcoidales bacterium]